MAARDIGFRAATVTSSVDQRCRRAALTLKVPPGEVRADLGQDTLAGTEASSMPDVLLPSTGVSFRTRSMAACMPTDWISRDSLAALNEGFVVAIMLEAR